MTENNYLVPGNLKFPFGQPLKKIRQTDRSSKEVFVLGDHPGAVHCRWLDTNNRQIAASLPVANEPYIYWKGEDTESIISKVRIPEKAGRLTRPLNTSMNGTAGRALDKLILNPMKLSRGSAWLCYLEQEFRTNRNQELAIKIKYEPLTEALGLLPANVPGLKKSRTAGKERIREILQELKESNAKKIILLGDLAIYHFLYKPGFTKMKRLEDFGDSPGEYGHFHEIDINGTNYQVLPLCHPRQVAKKGKSQGKWSRLHQQFLERRDGKEGEY